jgi:glycosyltransferase involved in cell wall biosynthesis
MMKILHTNFLHGWGGQSNRILNLCCGLAERGHRVVIAAPADSELLRRARDAGLATDGSMQFRRGLRPRALVRDLRRMRKLLNDERFDVIHTHGSQDSWLVAFANRPKRAPVVRTKHNIFPIRDHIANRWLYGRVFDRIICISGAIVEQCAAKPYLERAHLALVRSAIDLGRYAKPDPDRVASWRARWADRRPVLAVIGRLREEKGHRHLFDAVARLRNEFPAILLAVVGDGSLRLEFERYVDGLGLGDAVQFVGFQDDVPAILAAADLFVLPSLSEGLGTAVIEAAAAARPIVATRVGGIPDIIEDGKSGRLVAPGDVDSLVSAIGSLANDPDTAARMAGEARRHAFEQFTIRSLVEGTEKVYRDVCGAGAPSHQDS